MEKSSTSVCFIVNPTANRSRSVHHIDWLNREVHKRWERAEIVITRKDESVIKLAHQKAKEFDMLVACGGDGTVNQVVNGIAGTDTILGILPIGTGNDYVKTLKLTGTIPECLELIYQQKTHHVDLLRCSGDLDYWVANTLGMGLDGLTNYYSKSYKLIKGPIIYLLSAIKATFTYRGSSFKLIVDGKDLNDDYMMITACNGKWEGGKFFLAPDADLRDGKLNLVTIRKMSIPSILIYLPRFRWGPAKWMSKLDTRLAQKIEVTSTDPFAVHADGEHLGTEIHHLVISAEKRVLEVVTGY